jgi:hypothetical protein
VVIAVLLVVVGPVGSVVIAVLLVVVGPVGNVVIAVLLVVIRPVGPVGPTTTNNTAITTLQRQNQRLLLQLLSS